MKKILSIFILFLSVSHTNAQEKNSAIDWLSFEQLDRALAVKAKPVLLFFYTDWCTYCHKMLETGFENPEIVSKINQKYYAVKFDAESIDTVRFDGQVFAPKRTKKSRGKNHPIAHLLAKTKAGFIFPTTILLSKDFNMLYRKNEFLNRKQLLNLLNSK